MRANSELMYLQLRTRSARPSTFYVGYAYGFGTIYDDDLPGPVSRFPSSGYSVGESDGTVVLDVQRNGGLTGAVSVHYSTLAERDVRPDYTAASGTLTWADGDTSARTITITILPDGLLEGQE